MSHWHAILKSEFKFCQQAEFETVTRTRTRTDSETTQARTQPEGSESDCAVAATGMPVPGPVGFKIMNHVFNFRLHKHLNFLFHIISKLPMIARPLLLELRNLNLQVINLAKLGFANLKQCEFSLMHFALVKPCKTTTCNYKCNTQVLQVFPTIQAISRKNKGQALLSSALSDRYFNYARVPGPQMWPSPSPWPYSKCSRTVGVECSC